MRTKAELLTELAMSRQALAADLPEICCRLNPVARVRRSFARNPATWCAASAMVGLVASGLLRSSSGKRPGTNGGKTRKAIHRSLPAFAWLLKSAWTLARPEAEKLLRTQLTSLLNEDRRSESPPIRKDSA